MGTIQMRGSLGSVGSTGRHGEAGSFNAITSALHHLGRVEQARRERQQLDRITTAIANGATTVEAIAAEAKQETEFSKGIPGFLQRVGGGFQPSPGGVESEILQTIVGEKLRQALAPKSLLTPQETREGALIKAGIKPRAGSASGKPLTTTSLKEYDKTMDTYIDGAEKGKAGGFNFTKDNLMKAWAGFKTSANFNRLKPGQQAQLIEMFNSKIAARNAKTNRIQRFFTRKEKEVGEYDWNPQSIKLKEPERRRARVPAPPSGGFKAISDEDVDEAIDRAIENLGPGATEKEIEKEVNRILGITGV